MLFSKELWPGLADGSIRVAFRCWKRPTVKSGGTLRTPAGVLAIDAVATIEPDQITDADAVLAGFDNRREALGALPGAADRTLYRIDFHHAGRDPRTALQEQAALTDADVAALVARLDRLDERSTDGPWTRPVLQLIDRCPARPAAELAVTMGQDRTRFKRRVRRLKELGLTVSLSPGYRLSARGAALLDRLGAE